MYEDKTLVCKECGKEFVFTAGEQEMCIRDRGRGDPASGVGSGSGCVPAGMAGRPRSGRPVLPGGRPVSDCRPVCGRRGGGAAGQREAPEKAPGPPRTDPEAREAEIGHGENHENAPAAKKHLTPDYTCLLYTSRCV